MDIGERIKILTEGAKYDVSCSSSGSRTTAKRGYLGSAAPHGVCHSFTADGRCISLLKILLSNKCVYDCLYCINRRTESIPRASLTPKELCELVIGFYKRNYIEGLFLSSAVEVSPNRTMETLAQTVQMLRTEYKFRGYIHLKGIPGADNELIDYASRWVDRISLNIELPSEKSLLLLAPQKKKEAILSPMRMLSQTYIASQIERPKIIKIPAGQTTQMIVGASPETDGQIMRLTQGLYDHYRLKRVYYSAYSPVTTNSLLPAVPPDLRREHRLYEADWLLRFYGYKAEELLPINRNLSLDLDVKSDWAINNFNMFPLEINTAPYELLLRVPGIGVRNAYRITEARKHGRLDRDALKKMRVVLKRAEYFVTINGKFFGAADTPHKIRNSLMGKSLSAPPPKYKQLGFFDEPLITGEF
ncbi:MAG: putative DNA modification/repair radical SAM protein [Clostridia bacterium]